MIYLLDDPLFQSAMMDPYQAMAQSPAAMGMYQQGMPHQHAHRHRGKMGQMGQQLFPDPWSLMPSMFDAALAIPAGTPSLNLRLDDKENTYIVEAQTPGHPLLSTQHTCIHTCMAVLLRIQYEKRQAEIHCKATKI